MPLQRYDIKNDRGEFEVHFWLVTNSPVLGETGAVEAIIHRVKDSTPSVLLATHGKTRIPWRMDPAFPDFEKELRGGNALAPAPLDAPAQELPASALRRDRDFYAMAEALPVIAWTADATGWIDWYNHRWYEYTGQTREEAAGWGWQAAHHPEDFPKVMEAWPHSVATGTPFELEFRLRGADAEYRWFLTRAIPERDGNGNVTRWYGSNVDIQAQKETLERSVRVSETLQRVFLPETLPDGPNLHFDALYVPAERDALVGGDWYDATLLPDGRYLLSIGDVAGHGLDASVVAGRLRQAVTDFAFTNDQPAAILCSVNRVLCHQSPHILATALVGLIDRNCTRFTYACAGHPPPVFARRNTAATELRHGGSMLGLSSDLETVNHSIALERDDVLVLYTDGLTESTRQMQRAEERLSESVTRLALTPEEAHPAAAIRRAVLGMSAPTDDVALLVVRCAARPSLTQADPDLGTAEKRWRFHSSDAYTAQLSRKRLMEFIQSHSPASESLFEAELVLGEILANTVEHAPGLVEIHIDWRGEKPVVTVLDTGPGLDRLLAELPASDLDENGRGLFLIRTLADEFSVTRAAGYGTKLRVVLPLKRTRR